PDAWGSEHETSAGSCNRPTSLLPTIICQWARYTYPRIRRRTALTRQAARACQRRRKSRESEPHCANKPLFDQGVSGVFSRRQPHAKARQERHHGGSEPTPYAGQLRCILQPHAVTTTLAFVACGLLVRRDAISAAHSTKRPVSQDWRSTAG